VGLFLVLVGCCERVFFSSAVVFVCWTDARPSPLPPPPSSSSSSSSAGAAGRGRGRGAAGLRRARRQARGKRAGVTDRGGSVVSVLLSSFSLVGGARRSCRSPRPALLKKTSPSLSFSSPAFDNPPPLVQKKPTGAPGRAARAADGARGPGGGQEEAHRVDAEQLICRAAFGAASVSSSPSSAQGASLFSRLDNRKSHHSHHC
jgi:hypothetical protein